MGVVLVLDKRIITKNYGRYFLEALPQCPTRHQSLEQVLSWQRDFLEKK